MQKFTVISKEDVRSYLNKFTLLTAYFSAVQQDNQWVFRIFYFLAVNFDEYFYTFPTRVSARIGVHNLKVKLTLPCVPNLCCHNSNDGVSNSLICSEAKNWSKVFSLKKYIFTYIYNPLILQQFWARFSNAWNSSTKH